jgi:hypothetical protein
MSVKNPSAAAGSSYMGCLTLLVFMALTAGPFYLFVHIRFGRTVDTGATLAASFVFFIAYMWLQEIGPIRRNERLLRAIARGGQLLRDGELAAASGPIYAVAGHDPLVAPFTGRPCLAYKYSVEVPTAKQSKGRYGGYAYVPSEVVTPAGSIAILSMPNLEQLAERRCRDEQERRRAQAYVEATPFEELGIFDWVRIYRKARALFTEIGPARQDIHISGSPHSVDACLLKERSVEPGTLVSVVGRYSAERGGLTQDMSDPLSLKLFPGDATTVARELRTRMRLRAALALLFVVVPYAILVGVALHARR